MSTAAVESLLSQAREQALAQEWSKSIALSLQAKSLAPDDFDVVTNLGMNLLKVERRAEALGCFQQAVTLSPGAEAYTNLGAAFSITEDADSASLALKQALAKEPGYTLAAKLLAGICCSDSRHAEAKQILRSILASTPQDSEALLFSAKYSEFENDLEGAESTYRRVLDGDSDNAEASRALARIALYRARIKTAPVSDPAKTVIMLVEDHRIDRRVLDEARSLNRAGWQVTVIAGMPPSDNPLSCEESYPDVEIVRVHDRRTIGIECLGGFEVAYFRIMGSDFEIPRMARYWQAVLPNRGWHHRINEFFWEALEHPAAIYVAHDLPQLANATLVSRFYGAYLAYDAHEFYPELVWLRPEEKQALKELDTALSPEADLITTVNESLVRLMHERYQIDPEVILNCPSGLTVPSSDQRPDIIRKHLGIPQDVKVLLYQGNLMARVRNLENVIRAMSLIARSDVAFVLMGHDYGHKPFLMEFARECGVLDKKVFFHDGVPQSELLKYTASADAGIIPYLGVDLNVQYCAPNKLFEFLVAGLPILSSDLPELSRFVSGQGVGLNRPFNNPDEIARAIDEFFSADLGVFRARLHEIGPRYIWENHEGPKLVELYRRMILQPPKGAHVKHLLG